MSVMVLSAPPWWSHRWVLRSPDGMVLHAVGIPYPGDAEMVSKAVRDHEGLRSTGGDYRPGDPSSDGLQSKLQAAYGPPFSE
ncbi:hypothetical protein LINPERHAP2_LOCUS28590 [Linum perenne]